MAIEINDEKAISIIERRRQQRHGKLIAYQAVSSGSKRRDGSSAKNQHQSGARHDKRGAACSFMNDMA